MARRGPRRVTVTIQAHLAGAFDALVLIEGRPPDQLVREILCATLAEA